MSAKVFVTGAGLVACGEHFERSLSSLAVEAARNAVDDAGPALPTAVVFGSAFAEALTGQAHASAHLASALTTELGLPAGSLEAYAVSADGASGAAALRLAELQIRAGAHEHVLVVGVEKMTDLPPARVAAVRAMGLDQEREAVFGFTPHAQAALLMTRYFHEWGHAPKALAAFPCLAHDHAIGAPHAMMRRAVSREAYGKAPAVASPLGLYDVAPDCDGAAAVVVSRSATGRAPVRITGSAMLHAPLSLVARREPTRLLSAGDSARAALAMAARALSEVSFFELDDAFSIQAALSLEALGAADVGHAPRLADDGYYGRTGRLPICTQGGSKARGNPLGAAGLYRIVEAVQQLRGEALGCQLGEAKVGLVQSLGGFGATAITHVLE